ncbi:MAG: CvpA family protein [Alphaproteobacteria bacterium]|nr:CvpA family protein [Alphaproteobacteria bacterium]
MYELNNLDIIILAVVAVSALIALLRGLIKEVLSIIGWVLVTMLIIYLLPICLPFAQNFISNGIVAGVAASLVIFVVFAVIWIYATSGLTSKIRSSKLNGLDRLLGLFFGIMRAFLLVVLFNIMVNWIIPPANQTEILTQSRYFQLAGKFAQPLEEMIPQETLELMKAKSKELSPEAKEQQKEQDSLELFEKLAQPQIKKAADKKDTAVSGYKESERDSLDRLIDSVE